MSHTITHTHPHRDINSQSIQTYPYHSYSNKNTILDQFSDKIQKKKKKKKTHKSTNVHTQTPPFKPKSKKKKKKKNHQIFVTQPRPEPTIEEENDRWRFRCVIRYLWQLQRSWVSLCQTHTNLDSNPNPNRSTNANSLFHGCGTPKLVSVAPDWSLQ